MLSFYKEGLFLFFVFNVVSSLSFHAHSYLFQSFFICLLLVVWCLSNLPPNLCWLTPFRLFTSLFNFPFIGDVQVEERPKRFSSSIDWHSFTKWLTTSHCLILGFLTKKFSRRFRKNSFSAQLRHMAELFSLIN